MRNKKAFLGDQCKEMEENNRLGKTRVLSRKIRDTKGIFHAKIGTIKDRKCMDLIEAEDIKVRWQEYTVSSFFSPFMERILHKREAVWLGGPWRRDHCTA